MLLRMHWQSNSQEKNLTIETPKVYYSHLPKMPTTPLLVDEYNSNSRSNLDPCH